MLDDRIDEVAREQTRGEPGGDFRARVFAKIEREAGSGRRNWKWVLAPVALASLMVIAFVSYQIDDPAPTTGRTAASEIPLKPEIRPPVLSQPERVEGTPNPSNLAAEAPDTLARIPDARIQASYPPISEELAPPAIIIASIVPTPIDSAAIPPIDLMETQALSVAALDVGPLADQ